ncbi:hypothetical protein RclHR1_00810015 [Rhizophagus clarus]|uniref:Uncharacterized protein n=1 Tax=Rhizophagus clarus TaxID=94130 RepID=A0A2Z6S6D7_9GLOM|nr:hypothetical protein RclHR1_00810015 [Rhizophagus clarus]
MIPYDIAIQLTAMHGIRSEMEQWRPNALRKYMSNSKRSSSATEARNLFKKHLNDIIRTIEDFLMSSPDATPSAPESASISALINRDTEQDRQAEEIKQYIKAISTSD